MPDDAVVSVVAGTFLTADKDGVRLPHAWTSSGVGVRTDFTGAHLLHLAVAGCILNDTYREAAALNIEIAGVRVSAGGGFAPPTWQSTGIQYVLEIDSPASAQDVEQLQLRVEQVAEIPKALRLGCQVVRRVP